MKKLISLTLALLLALACLPALGEGFASDYAAMNEAAASVLVLTMYDENGKELGTASGFIAFDESHAVTSFAVLEAARVEAVSDEGQALGPVKVLGCDSDCNLAILAFDEPTGLKPLEFNDSGTVRRGAACVSIGAQNGVNSITTGHIATAFTVKGLDLIQFTATISEGASGGALLDENGKVAAVTMFGLSGQIGYTVVQNMNFALSARHVTELWGFCKDDEPVDLEDWGITDIGADSPYKDAPKGFTVINDTGYKLSSLSISAIRVRGEGYDLVQNLTLNWVEKGQVINFALDYGTELAGNESLQFGIGYSGSYGRGNISKRYKSLEEFFGKTFSLTVNLSAGTMLLTEIEDDNKQPTQRHVKEAVETEDDFEIPKIIERERVNKLGNDICVVINDTELMIDYIVVSNNVDVRTEYGPMMTKPGDYCTVELPRKLIQDSGKYSWQLSVRLRDNPNVHPSITVKNPEELCGKVIYVKYDGQTGKFYLEFD